MTHKQIIRVSPGEVLLEEFLKPLGISQRRLAICTNLPVSRIADVVHDRRDITPATAIRLAAAFETTPNFWMNMQTAWSLFKLQDEVLDVTPIYEGA